MAAAATRPGTSRRRPSSGTAAKAMTAAAHSIVRCVPISGMATSAARNVPRMLPAVESAKMRPATRPASSTPVAASLTANGVTMPSSTTGGANSASAAANEPSTAPVDSVSMPRTESSSSGRATNGTAAMSAAATMTIVASSVADGRRSASLPPNQ